MCSALPHLIYVTPTTLYCRYMHTYTSMKVHHSFTPPTIYLSRYFPHPTSLSLSLSLKHTHTMLLLDVHLNILNFCFTSLASNFSFKDCVWTIFSKCQIDYFSSDNERWFKSVNLCSSGHLKLKAAKNTLFLDHNNKYVIVLFWCHPYNLNQLFANLF